MNGRSWLVAAFVAMLVVTLLVLASTRSEKTPVAVPTTVPTLAATPCPPEGRGGDPILNRLKNRTEEPTSYQPVTVAQILGWNWPRSAERKDYAKFGPQDRAYIAGFNARAVVTEGYLLEVKLQGPETANCGISYPTEEDFHLWIVGSNLEGKATSVVVEVSPRVRRDRPDLFLRNLQSLVGKKIRVYGWVMFDPEHPDQVGKTRGTLWEIHPVMKVEEVK